MITASIPATPPPGPPTRGTAAASADPAPALRAAAQRLEAGFIKEMLREAGLGRPPAGLGGGEAEGQWTSFLLDAQADAIARSGGVGLAEALFEALSRRAG